MDSKAAETMGEENNGVGASGTEPTLPTELAGPLKYVSRWAKHHNGLLFRMMRLKNQARDAGLPYLTQKEIDEFRIEQPVLAERYDLNKKVMRKQMEAGAVVTSSFIVAGVYYRQPVALIMAGVSALCAPFGAAPFIEFYYGIHKYDKLEPAEELTKWYLRRNGITPHPLADDYLADPSGRANKNADT